MGGLREIRRVLKPGGRFFATTFFQGAYGVGMPSRPAAGPSASSTTRTSCGSCSLVRARPRWGRRAARGARCAIIRAVVPGGPEAREGFEEETREDEAREGEAREFLQSDVEVILE